MNILHVLLSFSLSLSYFVSGNPTTSHPDKQALRYGFQNTHDCKSFEKSFLCVRKCLDKHYDVAVSDKNCKCTCYSKKDKAKYRPRNENATTWVGGAPSTKLPRWYQTTGADEKEKKAEYAVEQKTTIASNEEDGAGYQDGTAETVNPDEIVETGKTDESAPEVTGEPGKPGEPGEPGEPAVTGDPREPEEPGETVQEQQDSQTGETEAAQPEEGKTEAIKEEEQAITGETEAAQENEAAQKEETEATPAQEAETT